MEGGVVSCARRRDWVAWAGKESFPFLSHKCRLPCRRCLHWVPQGACISRGIWGLPGGRNLTGGLRLPRHPGSDPKCLSSNALLSFLPPLAKGVLWSRLRTQFTVCLMVLPARISGEAHSVSHLSLNTQALGCQDEVRLPLTGDGDPLQAAGQGSSMIQGKKLRM